VFSKLQVANGETDVELHLVQFNAAAHTLAVLDDPASRYDLATAAQKRGALAAINGGYFHPDRTPLGLVIRQGVQIHPREKARLLSGLVVVTKGRIALLRAAEFKPGAGVWEALQAGPFLVDAGEPVAGLNAERRAMRTFVFSQGSEQFGFGVCASLTLAETGSVLATRNLVPGGKIRRALNLDGGSSSGLWVAGAKPFYLREGKDVRNFLAVIAR
jgi:uncharacterized protein YigE (DUF2233 family)